jgi:hypothetical protein
LFMQDHAFKFIVMKPSPLISLNCFFGAPFGTNFELEVIPNNPIMLCP